MRTLGKNIKLTETNYTISYHDEGPDGKPVIIFIHGFPFNKSMWNVQTEALKESFRVITYDVRGHGDTDSGIGDFSIDLFVDDLLFLMNSLKLDKVVLCGLSMGGYIALNAIKKYSERFEALVLCDTQCVADTPEQKEKRMKTIESIQENGVEKYADESIKNLFTSQSIIQKHEGIDIIKDMIINTTVKTLCSTLLALSTRRETCSNLSDINIPVLIMVGKEDKITPPEAAQFMHEKIENSILIILDHAAHVANIENSLEFNHQLKNFLHQFVESSL
ncbi:MAG: alpha/beta fold hydrolase [Bacteroidota bacterium]|nr:alpha/beta fold hydrolase [Bacteroidota bacterium]